MTADYHYLLFDLDHTLLDFNVAEDVALTELLQEARVSDIQAYKDFYIPMNRQLWDDLSLKKITKNILRLVVRKSPTGESTPTFSFMLK